MGRQVRTESIAQPTEALSDPDRKMDAPSLEGEDGDGGQHHQARRQDGHAVLLQRTRVRLNKPALSAYDIHTHIHVCGSILPPALRQLPNTPRDRTPSQTSIPLHVKTRKRT